MFFLFTLFTRIAVGVEVDDDASVPVVFLLASLRSQSKERSSLGRISQGPCSIREVFSEIMYKAVRAHNHGTSSGFS